MDKNITLIKINDERMTSMENIWSWICRSKSDQKLHCPFCKSKTLIERHKFGYHISKLCKANLDPSRDVIALIVKYANKQSNDDDILLFIEVCKQTDSVCYLCVNGKIVFSSKQEIKNRYGQDELRKMIQRYESMSESVKSHFNKLVDFVAKSKINFHLHGHKFCDMCLPGSHQMKSIETLNNRLQSFKQSKINFIAQEKDLKQFRSKKESTGVELPKKGISKTYKKRIMKHVKGVEQIVEELLRFDRGSRQEDRSSPKVTTLFQCFYILLGANVTEAQLKSITVERILTNQVSFDKLIDFFYNDGIEAPAAATKLTNLKAIYEHIGSFGKNFKDRGEAQRFKSILESHNYSKRPKQEAKATKRDKKMKSYLIENGLYLSQFDFCRLGNTALLVAQDFITRLEDMLSLKSVIHLPFLEPFQTAFFISLMVKGACYRSGEFRMMLINTMYQKENQSWHGFIKHNKNRSRKQQGGILYFDPRFSDIMERWVNVRLQINSASNHVWVDFLLNPWTSQRLSDNIKRLCNEIIPSFTGGTPQMLRYLQSAHLYSNYKSGKYTEEQMARLCKLFDRNLETWAENYSFTDEYLDRNPGEFLSNEIWQMDNSIVDQEKPYLERIANLKRLHNITAASFDPLKKSQTKQKRSSLNDNNDISAYSNSDDSFVPGIDVHPKKSKRRPNRSYNNEDDDIYANDDCFVADNDEPFQMDNYFWIHDPQEGCLLQYRHLRMLRDPYGWLEDAHITGAFSILFIKHLRQNFYGMPHYSLQAANDDDFAWKFKIQQINIENSHWVCALIEQLSSKRFKVVIYDSLLPKVLSRQSKSFLDKFLGEGCYNVEFAYVQRQIDNSSCGLFAVAFAVELALNHNEADVLHFDIARMRNHLENCLINRWFTPFPKIHR